jgi:hypothetical protein
MRLPLLTLITTISLLSRAQLTESFADSNFTAAPAWTGTAGAWTVNAARQLQSTHVLVNSTFYMSTACTISGDLQWDCWMRLAFATSSANYVDVWLLSDNPDPATPGTKGYFVRVGGTQDEVALYRKDATTIVKLIDGADGVTASADNVLRLRVYRFAGTFRLQRAGAAGSFTTEGVATDATYNSGAFFCLQVRQSTSSFFAKHFFDDISIRPFVPDTTAPAILDVEASSDTTIDVRFTEPIVPADAMQPTHYAIPGLGTATSIAMDASDGALLHLRFAGPFPSGQQLLLMVTNIHDEWGNELLLDTGSFMWYLPQRGDVVIHELMADPDPPVGLPAFEWVELQNVSGRAIALRGWKLLSPSVSSGPLPDITLAPDSFLLLSASGAAASLLPLGRVAGLSPFPALDNDGSTLALYTADGRLVHAVAYDKSWYHDAVKEDGGWSLEMIDAHNACGAGTNWRAAVDPSGGTPGRRNSVAANNRDENAPRLLRTWCPDSLHVIALFDEPLDSIAAAVAASYTLSNGAAVSSALPLGPLFTQVRLGLFAPLRAGVIYELQADAILDCAGNRIDAVNRAPVGLPADPLPGHLVINELLYQPRTGGAEYAELYFYGTAPIDLSRCYLAGRNSSGALTSLKRITSSPLILFPGDYAVCTEEPEAVAAQYTILRPQWLLRVSGMPALPDDGGSLVLLNASGEVLDEVHYDPGWQYPLLREPRGVALERLSAASPGQDRHNWHSAAATAGYGTPTARNSQHLDAIGESGLSITPHLFTPDGDGQDDLAFVEYVLDESGYMANITLFDAAGRRCRALVRNGLMARQGHWYWDGTDDKGAAAAPGLYVLQAEIFRTDGKKQLFRRTVALARRGMP